MTDLGYDQAMQLRSALMPIAYLLCTTGLILAVFRHWGNFHEILMSIVGIGVIVILLNGYPTALTTVADGFKTLRDQTTANAPGNAQSWTQIFDAQFEQPSWDQVAEKIEIAICQMFKWIGKIAIWFLDWVQSWAFNGLIAISPILLGGLAVPWTQGTGITFLTTSFGVAAWHLGIALVDILLASIATQLFAAVGIGGGVAAAATISVGLLPIFLGALAAIVCVAIALYLAVPIIIASVLRGSSPLTAGAKAGMEMTLTALGLAGMAGTRIAARAAGTGTESSPAKGGNSPEDGGDEETGMAPRPSTTSPTGNLPSAANRAAAASGAEVVEAAAARQSRILENYEDDSHSSQTRRKPQPRVTEVTQLVDQAG
jgi:hypothetical protein